jgi:hypothetical protein
MNEWGRDGLCRLGVRVMNGPDRICMLNSDNIGPQGLRAVKRLWRFALCECAPLSGPPTHVWCPDIGMWESSVWCVWCEP